MAKMKTYASFDDYLEDQSTRDQEIIRALRKLALVSAKTGPPPN